MPDALPAVTPTSDTKPPLTVEMLQAAKDTSTPAPGAGGWTPSLGTVYAIGAIGMTFGAAAPCFPAMVGGPLGVGLAGLCGAIAGGCAFFAMKSAGPREVTK